MTILTAEKTETLDVCFGNYPHTAALKDGRIKSDRVALRLNEVNPIFKSFLMMVREQKFDICEMALVTYLQAKAHGKPLTLLPATMMGRFQHGTMLYNSERGRVTPENLAGRRIGVRSFAQTTGVWLRGILWKDYGLDLGSVRWVTFEDAHVAEFRDPPGVERAPAGKDMTRMVLEGELDAAIFGGNIPTDPRLESVIADPDVAAKHWYRTHGTVPLNHMIVVKNSLSQTDPGVVREVFQMLQASKTAAGVPKPSTIDTLPFGYDAVKPALDLLSTYALEMKIIPRRYDVGELFDETTRVL